MRRILLVAFLICMITSVSFASKLSYEPETSTSASFAALDQYNTSHLTFVNYAKNDGTNEYWIRYTLLRDDTKILYSAALIIDGVKYDLQPVYDVTSKYAYAAYSNVDFNIYRGLSGAEPFRYYVIPADVVAKLMTAQKVTFAYDRIDKLGIKVPLYSDYIKDIKSILPLKYSDLGTYFKPTVAD